MTDPHNYALLIFDWEGTLMHASAPYSGVPSVLQALTSAGYLLAIATGKSRRGLAFDLEAHDLASYFTAYRCGDDGFSKPHPEMLHYLLTYTGIEPRQALMIGDTLSDLQMARAAQVDALAVSYGLEDKEILLSLNPRGCIDDIIDLPFWLEQRPLNDV